MHLHVICGEYDRPMTTVRSEAHLQESLAEITRLLDRHRVLETLTQRQEGPRRDIIEGLQHRQNLAELQKRLRTMHAADVAYVLEALPVEDRGTVWAQVGADQAGQVFVEVSDMVRQSLVDATSREDLVKLLLTLDPEDLAFVSESLPGDVVDEASRSLDSRDRSVYEDSILYEDDCVGHYMTREWVAVAETHSVQQALTDLRALGELPPQTDRVFVIDSRHVLRGAVPLHALLLRDPSSPVVGAMTSDTISFGPRQNASDAAKAFERYDVVTATVVDDRGKLVGRLTVDTVMDILRDESNLRALKRAGLSGTKISSPRRGTARAIGGPGSPSTSSRRSSPPALSASSRTRFGDWPRWRRSCPSLPA